MLINNINIMITLSTLPALFSAISFQRKLTRGLPPYPFPKETDAGSSPSDAPRQREKLIAAARPRVCAISKLIAAIAAIASLRHSAWRSVWSKKSARVTITPPGGGRTDRVNALSNFTHCCILRRWPFFQCHCGLIN